jgi:hypothetical protein
MFPNRPVAIPDDPHNMQYPQNPYQIVSDPINAFSQGPRQFPQQLQQQFQQQYGPPQPPPSFGPNQQLAMQMAGYPGPSGIRPQMQMNVGAFRPPVQVGEPGPGDMSRTPLEDLMNTPGMFNIEELIRTVMGQPQTGGTSTPGQPPGATGGGGSFTGPGGVIPTGPFQMFDPNKIPFGNFSGR